MSPVYTERQAGIYRCRFLGTKEVEFTDQATGELVQRWDWKFQEVADSTTVGEISRLTSRSLGPNTNALKFFTGIKGSKPANGEDSDTYKGALVDVVYGPNQAGNLSITGVIRVQDGAGGPIAAEMAPESTPAATKAPVAAVAASAPAELP